MATKVRTYRIDVDANAQKWDAIVIDENWWMTSQHLWTAASLDTWTCEGNIPVIGENWELPDSTIPSNAMKKSVYDPNNKNADAFDYCNLDNTPDIPVVNDPVVTFKQGWVTRWSISLNQAWETEIELLAWWLEAGKGIDIYENKIEVDYDTCSLCINDNSKLEVVDYSTIASWAAAWATAVQPNELATVAMSGSYCDLINKPEIPSAQIQSDWEQTNTNLPDYIKNKPTIGNATITLQKNGTDVDTFTLNQTANKCLNITLNKCDVWLSNVDNTSDADKPVSDATLAALACKQDNITDLNTIRSNACAGKTASETIANYWDIVTHNVSEFATATQGWKADTAVQPGDLCTVATTGAYDDLTGTPDLCPVATSGSYTDLTNIPALCTVATTWAYSDLTGAPALCNIATSWKYCDLSWTPALCTVATTWVYSDLTGTPNLATVATSWEYCDLTGIPNLCTIATSWKYCDLSWTPLLCNVAITAQYSDLLWTPDLCTVATSGKYCDLTWTPTIPTVIDTLTSSCTTEALSAKQGCILNSSIVSINWKIPSAATTENQLADKAFVNSSINAVAAYYITKDANWDQFATKAELDAATVYYSGWEVRVPTRNDYTIVASDETHDNATTRYTYNNGWQYQYTINETPLTQAQLNALNSGITSGKVSSYDSAVTTVNSLCTVATSGKYCDLSWLPTIPTNNNQLANGCGYTTCTGTLVASDLTPYAKSADLCTVATSWKYCDLSWIPIIPTDNCQLANWCWYITNAALSTYAKCCDMPTDNCQLANSCWYTTCTGTLVVSDLAPYAKSCALCTVATSGKYCDLTGLPTIPTNNNQLTNGCWYTTCTGTLVAWDLAPYAKSADLCTVATSGKYCDLSWIPTLATVATTGCYNDLTGTPTIPTKVSQLSNDCNFIDKSVNNLDNYTPTNSLSEVATSWAYCDLTWVPTLACVACSGSYEDLCCKPNLGVYQTTANMVCDLTSADNSHYPTAKAVADALSCAWAWDMLASMYDPCGCCADAFDYSKLHWTPNLCTVATSGKYCDLTWTPTIPAALSAGNGISITSNCINVQYDDSTIKKNSWNCLYVDLSNWTWICIKDNKVNAQNLFVINEDAIDVTYTWELWVAPYNTSYCYTNVCINPNCWIEWIEGATYIFNLDTKVATSACRNVRLKIGDGDYIPLMWTTSAAAWSSYFVKAAIRPFQYTTKYQKCWWLHIVTDSNTTYSAMSASEWYTGTCTACRTLRADYLKLITECRIRENAILKTSSSSQTVCTTASGCTTPLWVKSNSTSSYISFSNTSWWIGSYWVSCDKQPTFYNGTWYQLAYTSDIPTDNCQLCNSCWYVAWWDLVTVNWCSLVWSWDICIQSWTWWQINGTLCDQTDLQTALDWKLSKVTSTWADRAYIVNASWEQTTYNVAQWTSNWAIVRRTWTQIVVPETPTETCHAASKKYVDDHVWSQWWCITGTLCDQTDLQWVLDCKAQCCDIPDVSWKQDKATCGSVAPSSTPGYIWQQYVDTTNDKLYVATWTSSSSDWTEIWSWWGWAWDMAYADFEWETKTWASITLDLSSEITPSTDFVVNKPATIKEWQTYVLRVTSWATAYTMTLWTWVWNPFNVDLSLNANETAQFVFLATDSTTLELQKMWWWWDIEYVTEDEYEALPDSKLTNWVSYFIYE